MIPQTKPLRSKNPPVIPNTKGRSRNLFLSALTEEDFSRIEPHLETVQMELGTVLHAPNEPIRYVYFPENAVISVVTNLEDGTSIETGIIGNEGVVGIATILSDDVSPREANVQVVGGCQRMKAQIFREVFESNAELNRLALRFVFAFIAQISQNAACTNRHKIETRLARWLLMLHDRVKGDEILITQEFIAQMLGVHRPSVSESAQNLQEQGLIKYVRGQITVLDRQGLQETSCECYEAIKEAYDNYLNF